MKHLYNSDILGKTRWFIKRFGWQELWRKPSAVLSVPTDVVKTLSAELHNEIMKRNRLQDNYISLERSYNTIAAICRDREDEINRLTKAIDEMHAQTPPAATSASTRCSNISLVSGHRCIREAGHTGLHFISRVIPNETKV